MTTAGVLVLALLLDAALGEPRWLWDRWPHPAALMGRCISWCDTRLNHGTLRRLKGTLAMIGMALGAVVLGALLSKLGWMVELAIAAILIAQRSLVQHVKAVADALRLSLGDGRQAVAMIVGRDTTEMQRSDVARAAIESGAENLSDGVVAPAFWFLVAGIPGLLLYKITNTADSMIGHRTPRHEQFGWAAARLDDLLNLIPARLTGMLIALRYGVWHNWRGISAEARQHRSPNAGWPEAALAHALDIALSGPRTYHGVRRDFPYVHPHGRREIGPDEIDAACHALWQIWLILLGVTFILALILC